MPSNGLTLVGFMDEPTAIAHLRSACCPADPSDAALRTQWQSAQAQLGAPVPNAGNPQLLPIPPSSAAYISAFFSNPWVSGTLNTTYPGAVNIQVVLVEIDPLLAYQFTVDLDRSSHHCAALGKPPTVDALLPICLPAAPSQEPLLTQTIDRAVLISSECANVTVAAGGWFQGPPVNHPIGGVYIGTTLPFVHVTRLGGRCYLHNGFHRAIGMRAAGATHMPCLLRDVPDAAAAGIRSDRTTFSEAELTGTNPPTVGHFAGNRAWKVQLRKHRRVVHVSWAEHLMPVE
jgi:hypothetical protein